MKEYSIMDIQPGVLNKINRYKKMLLFVNLPMIVGIPLFVEFGLPEFKKKDINFVYMILHLTDFFLCFNSIVIYSMIQKMVTTIKYLPDEHKFAIRQFKDWLLREKETLYDPKDLIKCKRQTLNPFVGYKSVSNNSTRFATESTGLWHDRQLFDSMIFREVKRRIVRPPRGEKKQDTEKKEPEQNDKQ